jgi:hypothetical protein
MVFASHGGSDVIDTLLKQLRSPEASIRKQAIIALGKLCDPAALKGLEAVHSADPDPELRKLALKAGRRIQQQINLAEPDFLVGVETWGDGMSRRSRRLRVIPTWLLGDDAEGESWLLVDLALAVLSTLLGAVVFSLLALKPLLRATLPADSQLTNPVSVYLDTMFTPILSFDGRTLLLLGIIFGIVSLSMMLIFNGTVHFAARMLGAFESYADMLRHVLAAQSFMNLIFFALVTLVVLVSPSVVILPFLCAMGIIAVLAVCNWYSKLYAQAYDFTTMRGFAVLVIGAVFYTLLTTVGGVILPLL